jgi:hypothetical protein
MDLTQTERIPCEDIKGAADALSITLKWIDKGFSVQKVDKITQVFRISICETCPNFDAKDRRCLECCCPMDFKTSLKYDPFKSVANFKKTAVTCPLNKW